MTSDAADVADDPHLTTSTAVRFEYLGSVLALLLVPFPAAMVAWQTYRSQNPGAVLVATALVVSTMFAVWAVGRGPAKLAREIVGRS